MVLQFCRSGYIGARDLGSSIAFPIAEEVCFERNQTPTLVDGIGVFVIYLINFMAIKE